MAVAQIRQPALRPSLASQIRQLALRPSEGSQFEVEVTVISAKDLQNVNWHQGHLKPFAVVCLDSATKYHTKVDHDGGTKPTWNKKFTFPIPVDNHNPVLSFDIIHANADKDTNPLIGSARVALRDVVDEVGIGGKAIKPLKLKRPSGRLQGTLHVEIVVRQIKIKIVEVNFKVKYEIDVRALAVVQGGGGRACGGGGPRGGLVRLRK